MKLRAVFTSRSRSAALPAMNAPKDPSERRQGEQTTREMVGKDRSRARRRTLFGIIPEMNEAADRLGARSVPDPLGPRAVSAQELAARHHDARLDPGELFVSET